MFRPCDIYELFRGLTMDIRPDSYVNLYVKPLNKLVTFFKYRSIKDQNGTEKDTIICLSSTPEYSSFKNMMEDNPKEKIKYFTPGEFRCYNGRRYFLRIVNTKEQYNNYIHGISMNFIISENIPEEVKKMILTNVRR